MSAAGLPWLEPRERLEQRFGIRSHPAYRWDVIEIPTAAAFLDHLLWPLSVQVQPQFAPYLPATYFSGVTSFGENSRDNLRLTKRQLEPGFGTSRTIESGNTIGCEWSDGVASVRLRVWPLDRQEDTPLDIPAHGREPRLATACHIDIDTGFRLSATPEDMAWVASFVPIGKIAHGSHRSSEYDLEYVRASVANSDRLAGWVGRSADSRALIFHHADLYILPLSDVTGITVDRMLPAKGGGGSTLRVDCRSECKAAAVKSLVVSTAPAADDLNDLAAALAAAIGKPLVIGDYVHDC